MRVILCMCLCACVRLSPPNAPTRPRFVLRNASLASRPATRLPHKRIRADAVQTLLREHSPSLFFIFMKCAASMWCCRVAHFACLCVCACACVCLLCFLPFPFPSLFALLCCARDAAPTPSTVSLSLSVCVCHSTLRTCVRAAATHTRQKYFSARVSSVSPFLCFRSGAHLHINVFLPPCLCVCLWHHVTKPRDGVLGALY